MVDHRLIGRQLSEILPLLGCSPADPDRPPEDDPEYGLDRHVECRGRGLAVMIDGSDVCVCVQFFGAGKDPAYHPYTGDLPGGVRFENSRDDVRTLMGLPVRSNNGGAPVFGIKHRPWDLFRRDGLMVHCEYAENCGRILMVSVMPPSAKG